MPAVGRFCLANWQGCYFARNWLHIVKMRQIKQIPLRPVDDNACALRGTLLGLGALDPTRTASAGLEAGFRAFLQALWPLAEGKGVKRATFDLAVAGLTLDPSTPAASNQQAEFDKPLKSYLDEAVSLRRIARGRELFLASQEALKRIEQRSAARNSSLGLWHRDRLWAGEGRQGCHPLLGDPGVPAARPADLPG